MQIKVEKNKYKDSNYLFGQEDEDKEYIMEKKGRRLGKHLNRMLVIKDMKIM